MIGEYPPLLVAFFAGAAGFAIGFFVALAWSDSE